MLSLLSTTFKLFLITQFYALNVHFPHPQAGIVTPQHLRLLKALSVCAGALSWTPIRILSLSAPASVTILQSIGLLCSIVLFLKTAQTTGQGKLSVIYGRVTPRYVITTGPFESVRHPTYVSYALGWLSALVCCIVLSILGYRTTDVWIPNWMRVFLMLVVVGGLFNCYAAGADLEEKQFLEQKDIVWGEHIDEDVKNAYGEYMVKVKDRWIPGMF